MPAQHQSSGPRRVVPRRIVVKLGTGILTSGRAELDTARVAAVCGQLARLRAGGTEVVVVSSGAVGLGMSRLGLTRRPAEVTRKQACAAVGQSLLMHVWQRGFEPHDTAVAQVLLTHDDLRERRRHLNVKATLEQLLDYDVVPVINENDTVSAAEIRAMSKFGDNDTLSAMVASLLGAQYLVILSTAAGLIDLRGSGQIVPVVERITPQIEAMASGTRSETAIGGMVSKIAAAKVATKAGCGVFIASGAEPDILPKIFSGRNPGTFFAPSGLPLEAKKRWLAYFQRPEGAISVNACAVPVLREQGRSLLAVGVTGSRGNFARGDIIDILAPDESLVARGISGFDHADVPAIAGRTSDELRSLFPGRKRLEVIHRNDLVLL